MARAVHRSGLVALGIATALMASCAFAAKDVVVAVGSNFTTLDPYDANDTLSQAVAKSFYQGLFGLDKEMKLKNVLAESYTVSDDGLTYTVKLREGIKFQDGTDFNAAAVKAQFDEMKATVERFKDHPALLVWSIGNEAEADIFVSIHLNKIPQSEYWGWQTFFKKGNEQSKKLAQSLQSGLNQTIDKENKRESLKIENVYIIEHVEIPTAIVECGFLSNPEEKALLEQEEYQGKLAWGIYVGIMDYFLKPINNN